MLVGNAKAREKRQNSWRPSPQTLALPSLGSSHKAKGRQGWDEILAKSLPLSLLGGSDKNRAVGWGEKNSGSTEPKEDSPSPIEGMGTSGSSKSINLEHCKGCWRQQP